MCERESGNLCKFERQLTKRKGQYVCLKKKERKRKKERRKERKKEGKKKKEREKERKTDGKENNKRKLDDGPQFKECENWHMRIAIIVFRFFAEKCLH